MLSHLVIALFVKSEVFTIRSNDSINTGGQQDQANC
jgi:hypothetical protein